MLRRLILILLILLAVCVGMPLLGQDISMTVDDFNVPPEIGSCLLRGGLLDLRGDINPFYLTGDFDGDGRVDFAVQVKQKETGKKGILVCLSSSSSPVRLGAGVKFVWNDDMRFNAWYVARRLGPSAKKKPNVRFDSLYLQIKETASGLAYWDGKSFVWLQIED